MPTFTRKPVGKTGRRVHQPTVVDEEFLRKLLHRLCAQYYGATFNDTFYREKGRSVVQIRGLRPGLFDEFDFRFRELAECGGLLVVRSGIKDKPPFACWFEITAPGIDSEAIGSLDGRL